MDETKIPKEDIIKFIQNFKMKSNGKITIYKSDLKDIEISEQEFIDDILRFQSEHLLKIHWITGHHDNITNGVDIEPYTSLLHYFDIKKESKRKRRIENWSEIRSWIAIILSIIAIIISLCSCGTNKENIATTSKSVIDKDLSDDVSVHKCYYYEDKNASYITFYSFNHGEDDAVIMLDDNTIYYGSVYSQIAEDDYDKIIEYGDYALYVEQISSGDEDWAEVEVK